MSGRAALGWCASRSTALFIVSALLIANTAALKTKPYSAQTNHTGLLHIKDTSEAAAAAATSGPQQPPGPECPDWFKQYEAFHAAARGKPGSKYLIHEVPEHSIGKSGGFGDRLRGMLFALRLAAATKRVLLFTWARPVALQDLLVPSGPINWAPDGIKDYSKDQQQQAPVFRFMNGAHHPMVLNGSLVSATQQFLIVQTNQRMDAPCAGCPQLQEMHASTACVWTRLFRPTDEIIAEAEQELMRLFNSSRPQYVAVHLRLGGFTGEREHERGKGPLKNFAGAVRCANQLAHEQNISSSTPILMVTDNQHLRSFLREGQLPNVVAPSSDAVHIDQALALDNSLTAHRSTVVDLLLLSRAVCLVTSPGYRQGGWSGFSHHGWLLGGAKPCHIDFRRCI